MMTSLIFDRTQLRRQRDRAAKALNDHDFLFREVGERLADRLPDITRAFPKALDLGCRTGQLARLLGNRGKIETLYRCDLSPMMVERAGAPAFVADEEALPVAAGSLDLVLSNLSLHWVNDLPGCLLQIRHSLKPDGLFLATMFGGETLVELRQCLQDAELEVEGGASPRVSPFADVKDVGALLQRAGFALPVVDVDRITVTYRDPLRLLADLRGMGEANAIAARRRNFTPRATLLRAMELYRERHADQQGVVHATFQILTLTAWRPDPSQQRPLAPGSARTALADALAIPTRRQ